MAKSSSDAKITLSDDDLLGLESRLELNQLTSSDLEILKNVLSFNGWLQGQLEEKSVSILKLRNLFGIKTEKKKSLKPKEEDSTSTSIDANLPASNNSLIDAKSNTEKNKPKFNPEKNHGRNGAKDYTGCEMVTINHQTLSIGDNCPCCEEANSVGRLGRDEPKRIVRLVGRPLISGTVTIVEKLRCNLCQKRFEAEIPTKLAESEKYAPSCTSNIAVSRYYMGLPLHRLELWQQMSKIPLPDSTSWDLLKKLHAKINPIAKALYRLSAESTLTYFDDTPGKILNQIPLKNGRKGVYTTALVSQVDKNLIYLFITSNRYAGENLKKILDERTTAQPLITMSDASRNNIPKGMDEDLLARWIFCFCLTHSRRKFFEVYNFFSKECDFVLEVIGKVYGFDDYCKKNKLSSLERLNYHQVHSLPLMEALNHWLNNKLLYKETEPNSGFGKAIKYMLKHWHGLTQFLRNIDAPLDNNLCERAIKVVIRHRRNSLFYRSDFGAEVGDAFMSIIHTAKQCGADVVDYLNQLQIYSEKVASDPDHWLPWNYQQTIVKLNYEQQKLAS